MHQQLLLRGRPPLLSSSSSDNNDATSSSSFCVLLDGDWHLSLPREAVVAALMKRHLLSASASASTSRSSSSGAPLLSHPLTYDSALALADKVRVSRVRSLSFNERKAVCREKQASASIVFARFFARPISSFQPHLSLSLSLAHSFPSTSSKNLSSPLSFSLSLSVLARARRAAPAL